MVLALYGENVLTVTELTKDQASAVQETKKPVILTAAAGSGKTRTLVERYLFLLKAGHNPRTIAAITFTKKAAREMRNRVRSEAQKRLEKSASDKRQLWKSIVDVMDSARITTIHGLCREIIQSAPAQAAIDPLSGVADETITDLLRQEAIKQTVLYAAQQADYIGLFSVYTLNSLESVLTGLLYKRLSLPKERPSTVPADEDGRKLLIGFSEATTADAELARTAGDASGKLKDALPNILNDWQQCVNSKTLIDVLIHGDTMRRRARMPSAGKRDANNAVRAIYTAWDSYFSDLGKDLDPIKEVSWQAVQPQLWQLYGVLLNDYTRRLRQQRFLDNDDLEGMALSLLQQPEVQAYWQSQIGAILVDEFQDTNQRQNQLISLLCGTEQHKLFVVGDARQSIYQFRGADVTVFRDRIQAEAAMELTKTFRTHRGLVEIFDDLLPLVMGEPAPDVPAYKVPYTSVDPHRQVAKACIQAPYFEFQLASGDKKTDAMPKVAAQLAQRLIALHANGEIQDWSDVAILFRASTKFPIYEDALETAGVPFITVAGRGFYSRPEVRDVLNVLRALYDTYDDNAWTGMLRSPAFGLTDLSIWQLRGATDQKEQHRALSQAILSPDCVGELAPEQQVLANRAADIITRLLAMVDRITVADLMRLFLTETHYRAIMATGQERASRNLDKLIADAQQGQLTRISDYLNAIRSLRDIGARESEATSEAVGAVQLMTIHKSKGLEFPFVVLADAGKADRTAISDAVLVSPEGAVATKAARLDGYEPLAYKLLKKRQVDVSKAEEARIWYVAFTRAEEKIIVSGDVVKNKMKGLLSLLLGDEGLAINAELLEPNSQTIVETSHHQQPIAIYYNTTLPELEVSTPIERLKTDSKSSECVPLWQDLPTLNDNNLASNLMEVPDFWQIALPTDMSPRVVGQMTHRALEFGLFPGATVLNSLLIAELDKAGIFHPETRTKTITHVHMLLERVKNSELYAQLEAATDLLKEHPFALPSLGSGYIDVLYKDSIGWHIVDWKTDSIETETELAEKIADYTSQIQRYRQAVKASIAEVVSSRICFLNAFGAMHIVDV